MSSSGVGDGTVGVGSVSGVDSVLDVDFPAAPEAPLLPLPVKSWEEVQSVISGTARVLGSGHRAGGLVTVVFASAWSAASRWLVSALGAKVVGAAAGPFGRIVVCDVDVDEAARAVLGAWSARSGGLERIPAIAFLHRGRPVWIRAPPYGDRRVHCGPISMEQLTKWALEATIVGDATEEGIVEASREEDEGEGEVGVGEESGDEREEGTRTPSLAMPGTKVAFSRVAALSVPPKPKEKEGGKGKGVGVVGKRGGVPKVLIVDGSAATRGPGGMSLGAFFAV